MKKRNTSLCYISKFLIVLGFLASTINAECVAQQNNSALDKELEQIYRKSDFPGFAVSIIQNDSVLFAKGYGFADIKAKMPYTTSTIQPIASVSKTFIGLALVKALELGYFDLTTDINKILPFQISNPYYPQDTIRVIDLATHTSGLVDNDSIYIMTYSIGDSPKMQLKDFLKEYYSESGRMYSIQNFSKKKAGKQYQYSNIASALAAYLIEIKAGMSFSDFTDKFIFQPLGMAHTSWRNKVDFSKEYATLYEINKQSLPIYKEIINKDKSLKTYSCVTYPDGSLRSSISDLIKYLKEINNGFQGSSNIIDSQFYKLLFAKQFSEDNKPELMPESEPNRGLFWAYNRKGKLAHSGSDPGVSSFISYDPTTHIGKVLLINTQIEGDDNIKTVEFCKRLILEIEKYESIIINSN